MSDIEANNSETTPEEIVDSIRSIADEGTAEAIHEAIDAAQDAPADDALNLDIAPEGEAEPAPSVDDAVISPASWAEPAAPAGESRPDSCAAQVLSCALSVLFDPVWQTQRSGSSVGHREK